VSAPPTRNLRVTLVDDHAHFRDGVRRLLARRSRIEVVAEADNPQLGIAQAVRLRPDAVLMDLNMPGGSGIGAVARLAELAPEIPVLVITVSTAGTDVSDALLAGAAGYVLKGAGANELELAVCAAIDGETYLSPAIASRLVEYWRNVSARRPSDDQPVLSARELEVLHLIADGAENTEVAERLHISPHTVKRHVAAILVKLRAENRTQAAVHAVRQRLI
jgi:DNA-binding NarL/FixJ family response regulator